MVSVGWKRETVGHICREYGISERRGCELAGIGRNSFRYQLKRAEDEPLMKRIRELAYRHIRFGYRRIWALLCRSGLKINQKKVYRLWRLMGLSVRKRKRRKRRTGNQTGLMPKAFKPNEIWTYDFVFDGCGTGRKLKMLTLVDEFTRECLAVEVETSITGLKVKEVLQRVCGKRGYPRYIRSDNGSEFISEVVTEWQKEMGIESKFIEQGSPWQNGLGESFNGKLRDECLNVEWFSSLREAKVVIEMWRKSYNNERPHSSLDYKTPREFRIQFDSKLRSQKTLEIEKSLAFALV